MSGPYSATLTDGNDQTGVDDWTGLLGQNERILYQCSDAKLLGKESYSSIAGRMAAGAQAGVEQSMAARIRPTNLAGTSWVGGTQPSSSRQSNMPSQPQLPSHKGDLLLVTDKRLMLMKGGQVSFELKIDAESVKKDLDQIRVTNEKAVEAMNEENDQRKGDSIAKKFLHAYSPSAQKEYGLSKYGARLDYMVLLSAESRSRVLGGKEIELKLDDLNLAKQLEGLSRGVKFTLGMLNRGKKVGIRAYGLKFREEERYDEIAKLLQSRAESIKPIIAPYT